MDSFDLCFVDYGIWPGAGGRRFKVCVLDEKKMVDKLEGTSVFLAQRVVRRSRGLLTLEIGHGFRVAVVKKVP